MAMKVGKPVKWVEERSENFLATVHGRGQIAYVEAAAKRDGAITGLRLRLINDLGAHHELFGPIFPGLISIMVTGCYGIRDFKCETYGVFTNTTPVYAYRGIGGCESNYYVERAIDLVAAELGLDPVEVHRRNFIPADAFPYTTATGAVYDSGDYNLTLNRALEMAGYQQFREEQARLRREGRYLGIGFSTYVKQAGYGPSSKMPSAGWENATVRVEPSGKVTVLTGLSPHGQGQETTFAQLVADELGVPFGRRPGPSRRHRHRGDGHWHPRQPRHRRWRRRRHDVPGQGQGQGHRGRRSPPGGLTRRYGLQRQPDPRPR